MYTLLGILFVVGICVFSMKKAEKEEKIERERLKAEWVQKHNKEQQKEKEINSVINFAQTNGMDIRGLLKKRNEMYQKAINNYVAGRLAVPLKPIPVKPTYSGSVISAFADYHAEQINKENTQIYNDLLESSQENTSKGLRFLVQCNEIEQEIIKKLKNIPYSDSYVAILEKQFAEDSKVFKV